MAKPTSPHLIECILTSRIDLLAVAQLHGNRHMSLALVIFVRMVFSDSSRNDRPNAHEFFSTQRTTRTGVPTGAFSKNI
jgi:hypothetical protein